MLSEIKKIEFGFLSDSDILNMSVCQIDKPSLSVEEGSVYDPRMGCPENSQSKCITCHENVQVCTGHFGHIKLNTPIIIFHKQTVTMLKLFCHRCSRLRCFLEDLQVQNINTYVLMLEYIFKLPICGRCKAPHPEIKFDTGTLEITSSHKHLTEKTKRVLHPTQIKSIFDLIPDEDVLILHINPTLFHPRNLVLTVFPVIPTCCRPKHITVDNISDDDLSVLLIEILKLNRQLLDTKLTSEKFSTLTTQLNLKIQAYCDNSKGKSVHATTHRPMTGLKERITRKGGHIRQNMMGKRSNRTGRTVVGPDPSLKMNEVAIPEIWAESITIPEIVNPHNIESLTKLVNTPGKASVLIKPDGKKISIPVATENRGTILYHGDVITRGNTDIVVTNCKMTLQEGDKIMRKDKPIPLIFPGKKVLDIEVGDVVERYIRTGDYGLINRQPTLHRNSMQGMRLVVKPGKTMRFNLSIVKGFNMDFDGDEGNLFVQETIEGNTELQFLSNAKFNTLSFQRNSPEFTIVQDNLLGAFLMTSKKNLMTKADFMQCVMAIDTQYNFQTRLETIQKLRKEKDFNSQGLFGFIFPSDFLLKTTEIEIVNGVLIRGVFNASTLNKGQTSILYLIFSEYDSETAAQVVDNINFLTNCWLQMNPFSIGVKDCMLSDRTQKKAIDEVVNKFFKEANKIEATTEHPIIRESRVNVTLNKAKDIGLRIAKNALSPENNFICTVAAGSKGDYFNIAQISGLLGQQNLSGFRPTPTLSRNKRTLVHYPEVIVDDPLRKYKSRGFISHSFIEGLKPDEMFFHAMTGREGITKTAMGTASSGYIQRTIIKLNEDLKVAYDGSVRDANQNVFQYAFGNHGFDPSKSIIDDGTRVPLDIERLTARLNVGCEPNTYVKLSDDDIETIIEECKYVRSIPTPILESIQKKERDILIKKLQTVSISAGKVNMLKDMIIERYHTSRMMPGEAVGIIGAQSIGECQTQMTLNTFHTAGKLQKSSINRLEEILNMSKNFKHKSCTIYFKKQYETAEQVRMDLGCDLVYLIFSDLYNEEPVIWLENKTVIRYTLNIRKMFKYRVDTAKVANALMKELQHIFNDIDIEIGIDTVMLTFSENDRDFDLSFVDSIWICGIKGITETHLCYEKEWFIITEGSNLKQLLVHPLIDNSRIVCNDFWEVYECLGIEATKKFIWNDLKKVINGVNFEHIKLLVDKFVFKGKPTSLSRYSMRSNDVGPLSKATFEESIDVLLNACMKTETEDIRGVSAAIICGNVPRMGTGFFDLKLDFNKLKENQEPEPFY